MIAENQSGKVAFTMIKGVNKKVIEISRPDSAYFERAVLYLRPDVAEVPLQAAQTEVDAYFEAAAGRRRRHKLQAWLVFLSGMGTSAAVCTLVYLFIR